MIASYPTALLDTRTFIWLVTDPSRLSARARSFMADPDRRLMMSIASGWEMAIKTGLGKLPLDVPLDELLLDGPARALVEWLPVRPSHLLRVAVCRCTTATRSTD